MKLNLSVLALSTLAASAVGEVLQPRYAHGITAPERRDELPKHYQLRVLHIVRRQNGTNSSTSRTSTSSSSSGTTAPSPTTSYTSTIVRTETLPDGQQSTITDIVVVTPAPTNRPATTPTQGNPGLATGVAAALQVPGMALLAGAAAIGAAML